MGRFFLFKLNCGQEFFIYFIFGFLLPLLDSAVKTDRKVGRRKRGTGRSPPWSPARPSDPNCGPFVFLTKAKNQKISLERRNERNEPTNKQTESINPDNSSDHFYVIIIKRISHEWKTLAKFWFYLDMMNPDCLYVHMSHVNLYLFLESNWDVVV